MLRGSMRGPQSREQCKRTMAEIVNLRRVKKAKTRADKAAEADANRNKHGVAKPVRDLAKARGEKAARDLDAAQLKPKDE
jgi:hypothetical protein